MSAMKPTDENETSQEWMRKQDFLMTKELKVLWKRMCCIPITIWLAAFLPGITLFRFYYEDTPCLIESPSMIFLFSKVYDWIYLVINTFLWQVTT